MGRRRKTKCLVCNEAAECRGLCSADYQAARYAIETGATSEAELVAAGLMLAKYAAPRSRLREQLAGVLRKQRRRMQLPLPTPTITTAIPLINPPATH